MEEEFDEKTAFETDKMTRNWYHACMNETRIEEVGLNPLLDSLKSLGGWPVLEQEKKDYASFKWFEQVRLLNKEGQSIKTVMNHDIDVDNKNSSYMVLRLGQPILGLNRKHLLNGFNDTYVKNYYQYMVDAAVLLGGNRSRALSDLKKSLLFEVELANLSASKKERRSPNKFFIPVTLKELDNDTFTLQGISQPQSWLDYFRGLIQDSFRFTSGNLEYIDNRIDIEEDEVIIIRNPEYFINVLKLINRTEPRIVANYMSWRVVKASMSYLSKDARDIKKKYPMINGEEEETETRWKQCVKSAGFNQYMYDKGAAAASSMYVRRYFKKEHKAVVLQIIHYIRKSFKSIIDNASWMDDSTKLKAKAKLNNMKQIIGYVDEIINYDLMNNLHKGV